GTLTKVMEKLAEQIGGFAMRQDGLRRTLGLHPSTVSKMITRLVQLGWLRKTRSLEDRRTFDVRLTDVGLRRLRRAMRLVFRVRTHLKHFEDLFRRLRPDVHVLEGIHQHWLFVDEVARSFKDTSSLLYEFGYVEED